MRRTIIPQAQQQLPTLNAAMKNIDSPCLTRSVTGSSHHTSSQHFLAFALGLAMYAAPLYAQDVQITGDVNPSPATTPTWNVGGSLTVGNTGIGTLSISGNGAVINTFGTIAHDFGSNGTVTVSGGSWSNSGDLNVGGFGTGRLEISGTGAVSNSIGYIGGEMSSNGSVTVSGGTWTNSGGLFVGTGGTGSLEINGNGAVSSTFTTLGDLASGPGTLNLNGGSLTTGQLSKGDGSGSVTFNSGTLRLTGDQANLFNNFVAGNVVFNAGGGTIDTQGFSVATSQVIGGIGSLTKEGSGTLTLSGANTYTGGTTLSEGTLVLTNADSLGSGLLTFANGTTLSRTTDSLTLNNNLAINGDVTFSRIGGGNNSLDLNGAVSLAAGTHTLSSVNEGRPRFFGVISGDGGLTISGGTVTFAGTAANTYTGLTTVLSGGTLDLAKNSNLAAVPGDLVIDSGGTVNLAQNNPFGPTSTVTVNGLLNATAAGTSLSIPTLLGAGTIEFIGDEDPGTLTVGSGEFSGTIEESSNALSLTKTSADTLILSGNNSYTGTTTVSEGTLTIAHGSALGTTAAGTTVVDGATLALSGGITTAEAITLNGNGVADGGALRNISGNNSITGVVTLASASRIHSEANQLTLSGNITGAGQNLTLGGPGDILVNSNITTGTGTLTKDGVGILALTGTNTFTGNVTVEGGFLQLVGGSALADVVRVQLNSGTLLQVADSETVGNISGAGNISLGAFAPVTLTVGDSSDSIFSGVINEAAVGDGSLIKQGTGTLTLAGNNTYTGGTTISAGTLQIGNGGTTGSITGNITNNAALIFNRSNVLTYSDAISGSGTLEKQGSGVLTLTGSNTYSGSTLVSAGTLLIHGSLGNSAVTVSNGATLGGTGSVGGLVTVNNGGFLAPGNSPGTFTAEALTLNSGSTTVFELGSPSGTPGVDSDLIDVNGLLTLAGGGIEIVNFGGMNTGTYTLFNYGSLSGSALPITSAPGGYNFDFLFDTPNQILLDVNFNGLQFWDGTNTIAPSTPGGQGGAGTWNLANTNWTNQPGNASSSWSDLTAVFGGASGGTVTLGDDVAVAGLQFLTNGYQIAGAGHSITTSAPFNVLVDDGVTATIGAPITGTGALSKINSGTLVLTGNNTYSGGTTVSSGTLQLGNGGSTGMVAGNITNNANLIFDRTGDYFFNGVVSGNGNFIQNRSILRLSAAQTYTGSTTIRNNSILVLPFIDQSLSSSTTVDVEAGSSFDFSNSQLTISGLTGAGTVYSFLGANPATGNLTLDIASGTSTFDGSFGGPFPNFSITKAGAGTQIFTGNSSHTGTTTVSGGILLVNGNLGNSAVTVQNNAMLGGSGILGGNLTIESGGILAPGNSTGILTIGGNLNLGGGSTTRMELNNTTSGTGHDQIVVGGTASLAGTLELFFGGGMTNGDTFTLIDTANPILGNFDSVVNVLGNALTFSSTITNDYLLEITAVQTDYEPFANTPNQRAVATTIDNQALTGDLNDLIDFLNTLPGTSLPAAFDEIAPTQFAFLPEVVFAKTRFRQRGLAGQMRERRGGSSGMSTSRLQVSSASGSIDWINSALMAPRHERNFVSAIDSTAAPLLPSADNRWGFFASGNFEHIDDDRNGPGNQSNGGGLTLGADVQLNDSTIIGFFAGYEHSDLDFGANGGDVTASAATYGIYGTWFDPSGSWLEGSLGGGYHRFNTTRSVFGNNANGKTNANEFLANITYGHDIGLGSRSEWTLTPSAGLSYNALKTDGFTETGSLAPLTLQSQTAESLRSEIGLRLDYRREWSGVTWLPYVHCGWQHEFLDTSQSINARFATGGGIFTVNGPSSSRNTAVFGTGLNAIFSDTLSAGIGYNGEANNNFQIHQVFASLRMRF